VADKQAGKRSGRLRGTTVAPFRRVDSTNPDFITDSFVAKGERVAIIDSGSPADEICMGQIGAQRHRYGKGEEPKAIHASELTPGQPPDNRRTQVRQGALLHREYLF